MTIKKGTFVVFPLCFCVQFKLNNRTIQFFDYTRKTRCRKFNRTVERSIS